MDYNKEIEHTLNSLEEIGKAKAPDSFFDDLKDSFDKRDNEFIIPMYLLRIAAMLILILNLSVLYPMGLFNFDEKESASNLSEEYFSDYNLNIDSYTELAENEK